MVKVSLDFINVPGYHWYSLPQNNFVFAVEGQSSNRATDSISRAVDHDMILALQQSISRAVVRQRAPTTLKYREHF